MKNLIRSINKELVAVHSFNNNIVLHALSKDSFYSNESFFGKLDFTKNKQGEVVGFVLSGQNLTNIQFIKIK